MSQALSHVFLHLRHNPFETKEDWCEQWTKMAAILNVFETSNKDYILSKSIFFTDIHWAIYRIRYENKNVDDMGTSEKKN